MTVPSVRKATIKQAKASFKSRNNCPITDQEKRQLQRGIELDRRARWTKEKEKRKTEAQKEKAEKDKSQKHSVVLSTQRVGDRFGFKSSQRHLGAFFGGGAKAERAGEQVEPHGKIGDEIEVAQEDVDDGFGGNELDDDSLLEAFDSPQVVVSPSDTTKSARDPFSKPPSPSKKVKASPIKATPLTPPTPEDDLSWFEDDLASSTQIARDLDTPETSPVEENKEDVCTASFGSGDFDLAPEEIDMLDPPKPTEAEQDRMTMPPPPMPNSRARAQQIDGVKAPHDHSNAAVPASPTVSDPGFSLSQLESFVDDDLQLTQVVLG